MFKKHFKMVDLKEKIILCLDLSSEMAQKDLKSSDGEIFERLFHVKRAIRMFVNIKSQINTKHEYALMILQENAIWLEDFTNDPKEFMERLEYLNDTGECSTADLDSVFDVIIDSVKLPKVDRERNENLQSPSSYADNFILRLVIIYGRSSCVPVFNKLNKSFIQIASNPLIHIDALYIHDAPSNETIQLTNSKLCELDTNGKSYILNTVWKMANIYNEFSKLLSHSDQRLKQNVAEYELTTLSKPQAAYFVAPNVVSEQTEMILE